MNKFTQLAINLRAAKLLISTPATWTQGAAARDIANNSVSPFDPFAVCYCSAGAIVRKMPWIGQHEDAKSFLNAATNDSNCTIVGYNDSHTHTEVMAIWDKAILMVDVRSQKYQENTK